MTVDPGLCRGCRNAKEIVSDRGSHFWMCKLGLEDPRWPKYPRLPVLACSGFAPVSAAGENKKLG